MTQPYPVKTSSFPVKDNSGVKKWYVFDLETDNLYDDVTKIHCLVLYDINRDQTFTYGPDCIAAGLEHLATADVLIGHNILFFDIAVIRKLYPFYTFAAARIIDTLITTRLIWPKEKLYDMDTEQYTQVPTKLRGSASLKAWGYRLSDYKIDFKDFKEYSEEMLAYCVQDVSVTTKLLQHIQKQYCPEPALKLEHDFALAIEKQIRSGFPFDVDACLDLVDDLRTKQAVLEADLKKLFPPKKIETIFVPKVNNASRGYVKGQPFTKVMHEEFNPGSRQQIVDRLQTKYGWVPTKATEKGNPILDDDVLSALPYPEAKPLAEYMLIKKRLGQIADGNNAWLKLVNDETGCMHGDVITNGCITGRCAHRNPNMGQVPAGYSDYGKECRSLFHAPEGWALIGVDAKALELRCLAGYLAHWDDGEYARVVTDESIDIHLFNQKMFGVETRDIAKRLLYGIAYGCGALKAGTIIDPNEKNEIVLRNLGSAAINSFMKGIPALKKLKDKIANNIAARGYLIGLDGRPLFCRSDFKGLNVLLQSSGALIMKQVVIELHKKMYDLGYFYGHDWQQHGFIHDEIQVSCAPAMVEKLTAVALEAFPASQQFFNFQCPIEGDAHVGYSWDQTH
jgi:DNA polymerase I-like protein with 3'-5' exonuclease and polymerase domains